MKNIYISRPKLGRLVVGAAAMLCGVAMHTTAMAQTCSGTVTSSATPNDGRDDTAALERALQQATDRGATLTIPAGTYNLTRSTGITVSLKKSFTVNAVGATFVVGDQMERDAVSIDATSDSFNARLCGSDTKANVTWNGGHFDLRLMKVSTSVPIDTITTDRPTSSQATADALSIRGGHGSTSSTRKQKLGEVKVDNFSVRGSNGSWRTAGGDSGVFVMGATKVLIEDSRFDGIRDAGIYLSADEVNTSFGKDYKVQRVRVTNSYDGITSKRGADNIEFLNNTVTDTVRPFSIQPLKPENYAITVRVAGNTMTRCVRCIMIQNSNDVVVENNTLRGIGDAVAGDVTPVNSAGRQYEGISYEGVRGTNRIANNTLGGTTNSARGRSYTTWGIVYRKSGTRTNSGIAQSNNTYSGSWDERFIDRQ